MIKLKDEELAQIRELREQVVSVISRVGQLKLTHDLMLEDVEETKALIDSNVKEYKELLTKERSLIESISSIYGIGSVDVETGAFTPEK